MSVRAVGGSTKRAFDLAAGSVCLLLALPLFMVTAAAVRLSSWGPVFFRAERAGLGGGVFRLWKFRSMRTEGRRDWRSITEASDSRITAVGSVLRTTKLDELPQLFNVLRGEMSLVGPRPEEADVLTRHYPASISAEILRARPGMTGLLQVRVFPDMTNETVPPGVDPQEFYFRDQLPRRVAVDLEYVRRWTFGLDLAILLETVWCLLARAPFILLFGRRSISHALPPLNDAELIRRFEVHGSGAEGARRPGTSTRR